VTTASQLHPYNNQPLRLSRSYGSGPWATISSNTLKRFLRVPTSANMNDLNATAERAGALVESITSYSITQADITLKLEAKYLRADQDGHRWIDLPFGPVNSVTSIADEETTYSSDLTLQNDRIPDRVKVPAAASTSGEMTVVYSVGKSSFTDLPTNVQQAVLFAFGHFWNVRETVSSPELKEIPWSLSLVCQQFSRSVIG